IKVKKACEKVSRSMRRRVPPFDFKHLSNLDNFCAVQSGKGTSATGHLELSSDEAAHRAIMPSVVHDTERYANNRAEVSHEPVRRRERQMRGFKSVAHAQRFWSVHGVSQNLLRIGRHLLRSVN